MTHNLQHLIASVLLCCISGVASAKLPVASPQVPAKAVLAQKQAAAVRTKREAEALRKAQDRVVEYYRRHHLGIKTDKVKPKSVARRGRRGRLEKLFCQLGTEDRQARIAVELIGGRVRSFAYYSKWKPRTCSVHIVRDDAYSQWKDTAGVTVVTLNEDKGAFLIDYGRRAVKFLFRNVDRERFCGMDGKITGSLTITRGKSQCVLEGVMDDRSDILKDMPRAQATILDVTKMP